MTITVHTVPILRDNYCFVVEGDDKYCLIVDPGQVTPVESFIEANKLKPFLILNTHHHADHVAGNVELAARYKIKIAAPKAEMAHIPGASEGLVDGDTVGGHGISFRVLETPGHTMGHICFYEPQAGILLAGDTLFSMGCGRLMEGSAEHLYNALQKLKHLPPATQIYCGHEYTESNGVFALACEPDNADIKARIAQVAKLRLNDQPSIPVNLETELNTNPFLRAETLPEFAELRAKKDRF